MSELCIQKAPHGTVLNTKIRIFYATLIHSQSSLFVPAEISPVADHQPFPPVLWSSASLRQNSNGSEMLKCGFFGVLECALKLGRIVIVCWWSKMFFVELVRKRDVEFGYLLGSPSRPLDYFSRDSISGDKYCFFLGPGNLQGNSNWVNSKGGKPVGLLEFW